MSFADWFSWRKRTAGEEAEAQLAENRRRCEIERARREQHEDELFSRAFRLLRIRKTKERRP